MSKSNSAIQPYKCKLHHDLRRCLTQPCNYTLLTRNILGPMSERIWLPHFTAPPVQYILGYAAPLSKIPLGFSVSLLAHPPWNFSTTYIRTYIEALIQSLALMRSAISRCVRRFLENFRRLAIAVLTAGGEPWHNLPIYCTGEWSPTSPEN